jgi:hypothetical protein
MSAQTEHVSKEGREGGREGRREGGREEGTLRTHLLGGVSDFHRLGAEAEEGENEEGEDPGSSSVAVCVDPGGEERSV